MESRVHQMLWFQSNKYVFLESIEDFSMFQSAEIAPLDAEIAPQMS